MKKLILSITFLLLPCVCSAVTLLTEKEALNRILSDTDEITSKKIAISNEQLDAIKKQLGGNLVNTLKCKEALILNQQKEFTFYLGRKSGKTTGIAIIINEPGKWGQIRFIVSLTPQGLIRDVAVMKYTETRGRPVATRSFLRQFLGMNALDSIKLGMDIKGISGATVSSNVACFVIKKSLVLFNALLKDDLQNEI